MITLPELVQQLQIFLNEGITNRQSYYDYESRYWEIIYSCLNRSIEDLSARIPYAVQRWKKIQQNANEQSYPLPNDCLMVIQVVEYPPMERQRRYRFFPYWPIAPWGYNFGWFVQGRRIHIVPKRNFTANMVYAALIPRINWQIQHENSASSTPSYTAYFRRGGNVIRINDNGGWTAFRNALSSDPSSFYLTPIFIDGEVYCVDKVTTDATDIYLWLTSQLGYYGDTEDASDRSTVDWAYSYHVPLSRDYINILLYGAMYFLKTSSEETQEARQWKLKWEFELDRKRSDMARLQPPHSEVVRSVV